MVAQQAAECPHPPPQRHQSHYTESDAGSKARSQTVTIFTPQKQMLWLETSIVSLGGSAWAGKTDSTTIKGSQII